MHWKVKPCGVDTSNIQRICPGHFGEPTRRLRAWRICYNSRTLSWTGPDLQDVVDSWLCDPKEPPLLQASAFMFQERKDLGRKDLTAGQEQRLQKYEKNHAHKKFYDVATDPGWAARVENNDGRLMTLTTGMQIWPCDCIRRRCSVSLQ